MLYARGHLLLPACPALLISIDRISLYFSRFCACFFAKSILSRSIISVSIAAALGFLLFLHSIARVYSSDSVGGFTEYTPRKEMGVRMRVLGQKPIDSFASRVSSACTSAKDRPNFSSCVVGEESKTAALAARTRRARSETCRRLRHGANVVFSVSEYFVFMNDSCRVCLGRRNFSGPTVVSGANVVFILLCVCAGSLSDFGVKNVHVLISFTFLLEGVKSTVLFSLCL